MLTWTDSWTKTQRLAKDSNPDTLIQLKQDWNTGYHLFNEKLARYYSRKQQFANLIANQQLYQTPIDCVRVIGITALVSGSYQPVLKEIRSEFEWRNKNSYRLPGNWITHYFMIGKDQVGLWPIPSQNVANGIRFYYQPQDHDLSIDDSTSTSLNTTVTVTNGQTLVTATAAVFTQQMVGLSFQLTGVTDLTWYEILAVPTTTTLTLKEAFAGNTSSGNSFRIGQVSIIPQEYQDAPMHYALGNYFSAQGNEERSAFHLGTKEKPGMYYQMVQNCREDYSSSTQSSVITEDDELVNVMLTPPLPGDSQP